jgi:hypothetical protein
MPEMIGARKKAVAILNSTGSRRKDNQHLRDFSGILSADRHIVKKIRPKRVSVKRGKTLDMKLLEKLREPAHAHILGHNYVRSFTHGNLASEAYIRNNLAAFVTGVRAVLTRILPSIYEAKTFRGPENTMSRLKGACRDPDVLSAVDFADEGGVPLRINKAFGEAITQFFKDEDFAKNVCKIAISDYLSGKMIEKSVLRKVKLQTD